MPQNDSIEDKINKLKANREKVPLKILQTKYKTAYDNLKADIEHELALEVKEIYTELPEWLQGLKVKEEYAVEIVNIANGLLKELDCSRRISEAVSKQYDIEKARDIAREANRELHCRLEKYRSTKDCLYITEECLRPENPQEPWIYNDLVDKYYDHEAQEWKKAEQKPKGVLLFLRRKEV